MNPPRPPTHRVTFPYLNLQPWFSIEYAYILRLQRTWKSHKETNNGIKLWILSSVLLKFNPFGRDLVTICSTTFIESPMTLRLWISLSYTKESPNHNPSASAIFLEVIPNSYAYSYSLFSSRLKIPHIPTTPN